MKGVTMAQRTTSQVVGATLVGGMIGAGMALLFAPKSGKETREQISDQARKMKMQADAKLHRAKSSLSQKMDDAKDLKERLADAAHNTGKKAKSEIAELRTERSRQSHRQSPVLSAWEEEV